VNIQLCAKRVRFFARCAIGDLILVITFPAKRASRVPPRRQSLAFPLARGSSFFSLADGGKFQGEAIRSRDIISAQRRQALRNRILLLLLCSARGPPRSARRGATRRGAARRGGSCLPVPKIPGRGAPVRDVVFHRMTGQGGREGDITIRPLSRSPATAKYRNSRAGNFD